MSSFMKSDQSTLQASLLVPGLERGGPRPMHVALAAALKARILAGHLSPGARLPSSRSLAEELAVSRTTVVAAIDQLVAEGYAEGHPGSGVYVAANLPDSVLQARPQRPIAPAKEQGGLTEPRPPRPFQPAQPDLEAFPHAAWARLFLKVWRDPPAGLLAGGDAAGYVDLRREIARHLSAWRGIDCRPAEVIVTSGVAEALDLIAHALLEPGAMVAVEEPGYPLAARVLHRAGRRPLPVAIDEQGLDVAALTQSPHAASAVLVTPSRHYPLGATLPLARRLDLLSWARETTPPRLVIEDDYDSEYRYQGQPLPALMGLDPAAPVIYLGSFSKVLTSSLRLGFMVVREPFHAAVMHALAETGPRAALTAQPVLAHFMASGEFARHIRRTRRLYARRQRALVDAAGQYLGGLLRVDPAPAGMHLVARLDDALAGRMNDAEASRRAAAADIVAPALSDFYARIPRRQGLLLGYAGFDEAAIAGAAQALAVALTA